ncbi:MAG TPA: hypothetical protein VNU68_31275 [Verrucomicrobiae bacterium]|nr:hypothetical protein [Verrucomicrobiae bacterium]
MRLKTAIRKLERFRDGGLAEATKRAHARAHARVVATLVEVASAALRQELQPAVEQWPLLERWLQTVWAANSDSVSRFVLQPIDPTQAGELPAPPVPWEGEPASAQTVQSWVQAGAQRTSTDNRQGKVLTDIDADLDRTIRRMQGILLFAPEPLSAAVTAAREKYLPFIAEFVRLEEEAARAQASDLLVRAPQVVLRAWSQECLRVYAAVLQQEIRRALR